MAKEMALIEVLQKLYAAEAKLHISAWDDGWRVELCEEGDSAFARRRFTPDDIDELPKWIETESAKPRACEIADWPKVAHLRVVK